LWAEHAAEKKRSNPLLLRMSGGRRHPLEQVLVPQHQSSIVYHQIRFNTHDRARVTIA
jgi:hypothetical protein